MKQKLLLILMLLICIVGCTKNMPKKHASMDAVESAIKAQIKSDLISTDKYEETDFTGESIPGYNVLRLRDVDFDLPYVDELDNIEDAVIATSLLNNIADLVIVLKAANEEAADSAVSSMGKIHEEQIRRLKTYLPDQEDKIDNYTIKKADIYVLYVVYDNPGSMEEAILSVIR